MVHTEKLSPDAHTDILLVPGGFGTRKLVSDVRFLQALRAACGSAGFILFVCTGSALFAKSGVLDDRKATDNKKAFA